MATKQASHSVLSLQEAAQAAAERGFGLGTEQDAGRGRVFVRRDLDIGSFGVNAFYQAASGGIVVGEHDELGPGAGGHEELYVVLAGGCTFTVDGEEVAMRATAWSSAAYPGVSPAFWLYRNEDYEGALAACRDALEAHPGNALILYNIACLESRLGRPEEAFEPLGASLATAPVFKEVAAADDDLAPLRDDPRFQALVA